MTKNRILLLFLVPLLGALLVAGVRLSGRSGDVSYGDVKPLGNGTVRSFVTHDTNGKPLSMGLLITASALENLPAQPPHMGPAHEITLGLPARVTGLPFDHISVDWNPLGHEPEGMYTEAHFDLHFYMMSEVDRDAINPTSSDFAVKAARHPDAAFLPANHVVAPGTVPRMGNHWVDTAAPELNGQPFSTTFIYGSWDGNVNFLEPMITKTYLESVREVEGQMVRHAIPQPASVEKPGYYPTAYSIEYDESTATYAIVLEGMQKR